MYNSTLSGEKSFQRLGSYEKMFSQRDILLLSFNSNVSIVQFARSRRVTHTKKTFITLDFFILRNGHLYKYIDTGFDKAIDKECNYFSLSYTLSHRHQNIISSSDPNGFVEEIQNHRLHLDKTLVVLPLFQEAKSNFSFESFQTICTRQ